MNNTLTVKELISQLSNFDSDKPVVISSIGINSSDSWDAQIEDVDEFKGNVRINFFLY